jgi:hypothetical protein
MDSIRVYSRSNSRPFAVVFICVNLRPSAVVISVFVIPYFAVLSVVKFAFHSCQFAVQSVSIRGWFLSA